MEILKSEVRNNEVYFHCNGGEISLLVDGELLYNSIFDHDERDYECFLGHDLLPTFLKNNKKIEVVKNYWAHKGQLSTDLFFIHNPKCAGSTIEQIGFTYGIRWGRFVKVYPSKDTPYCMKSDWHKPLWEYCLREIYGKKIFTIIRNPYDKMLSSFYCTRGNNIFTKDPYQITDKVEFNKIIRQVIDFKYTFPQIDFAYVDGQKVADYILKLETLASDFNFMCRQNELLINECEIDKYKVNTSYKKIFSKYDFDSQTVDLINKKFEADFVTFNYPFL